MNKKLTQIVISFVVVLSLGWFLMWKSVGYNKNTELGSYFESEQISPQDLKASAEENNAGEKIYKNDASGFSLKIPEDSKVSEWEDSAGKTILIKNTKYETQIYVSKFEENISLNIARIKKDVPDIKMENPVEIKTDGVSTVAFFSNDGTQKYREIWFVNKGNLYQVLAPASQDSLIGEIMQTWTWNK